MNQYPHCACHLSFSFPRFTSRSLVSPLPSCFSAWPSLFRAIPLSLSTRCFSLRLSLFFIYFHVLSSYFLPRVFCRSTHPSVLQLSFFHSTRCSLPLLVLSSLSFYFPLWFTIRKPSRYHNVRFIGIPSFSARLRSCCFLLAPSKKVVTPKRECEKEARRRDRRGEKVTSMGRVE